MPTSRTRKKTQDNKKKQAHVNEEKARTESYKRIFGSALDEIPACTACHKDRVEVRLEDVPEKHRPGIEKMFVTFQAQGMEIRQVVYCENCDEYSGLSDWSSF